MFHCLVWKRDLRIATSGLASDRVSSLPFISLVFDLVFAVTIIIPIVLVARPGGAASIGGHSRRRVVPGAIGGRTRDGNRDLAHVVLRLCYNSSTFGMNVLLVLRKALVLLAWVVPSSR